MGNPMPIINNSISDGIVIRHKEFVQDVVCPASGTFSNLAFDINPTNAQLFSWLSRIAINFQEYRINGMMAYYKPTSSDALVSSGNSALGTVIMATNYNSLATPFSTKSQMENAQFTTSSKPSMPCEHFFECAQRNTAVGNILYTMPAQKPTNYNPQLYNLGKFQLGVSGTPNNAGTVIGELWISYDIELLKPIEPVNAGWFNYLESCLAIFSQGSPKVGTSGVNSGDAFAYASTISADANIVNGTTVALPSTRGWQSNAFGIKVVGGGTTSLVLAIPPAATSPDTDYILEVQWMNLSAALGTTNAVSFTGGTNVVEQNYWAPTVNLVGLGYSSIRYSTSTQAVADGVAFGGSYCFSPTGDAAARGYNMTITLGGADLTGTSSGRYIVRMRTALGYLTNNA